MLITLFFMRTGQFMLLPFLAIYMARYSHASPALIGLVIGSGPFIYGATALGAGVFVDRFGVKNLMVLSLLIGGITFFFFFYKHTVFWCLSMNILTGITRAFFDVGSRSYGIAGISLPVRKLCFSLRFMVINTAGAIGPVAGAYFAATNSTISFKLIGLLYVASSVLSMFILISADKNNIESSVNKPASFKELPKILLTDTCLQILLVTSFIFWIIYSQLDSTLAQYLNAALKDGVRVYSILLIVNAVGCVALQLVVTHLTKDLDESVVSLIGMLFFAISNILMALFLNFSVLVLAMVMIVLVETSILPLNDFLLARIAPPDRIGTYYGAIGVATLGLGIGPIVGGIIYQFYGATSMFLMCAALCVVMMVLYRKIHFKINQKQIQLPANLTNNEVVS